MWTAGQFFAGEAKTAAASTKPSTPQQVFRTWRTANGKYELIAAFVKATSDTVYIKRKDTGVIIPVKRELLSKPDQAWLRTQKH